MLIFLEREQRRIFLFRLGAGELILSPRNYPYFPFHLVLEKLGAIKAMDDRRPSLVLPVEFPKCERNGLIGVL
jgi:hypothetical protein